MDSPLRLGTGSGSRANTPGAKVAVQMLDALSVTGTDSVYSSTSAARAGAGAGAGAGATGYEYLESTFVSFPSVDQVTGIPVASQRELMEKSARARSQRKHSTAYGGYVGDPLAVGGASTGADQREMQMQQQQVCYTCLALSLSLPPSLSPTR